MDELTRERFWPTPTRREEPTVNEAQRARRHVLVGKTSATLGRWVWVERHVAHRARTREEAQSA